METAFETILVNAQNGVVRLTLNRPHRANAINHQMRRDILQVLPLIVADESNRTIVVTGAGRHFCGGADLKELREESGGTIPADFIDALAACPLPVVAAINGAAMGGGMEIALACDFRVVADTAFLGLPEIQFGGVPAGGGTQRASRLVGPGIAKELVMLGLPLDAWAALEKGLVTRVFLADRFDEDVEHFAQILVDRPSFAIAAAKRAIDEGLQLSLVDGLALETSIIADMATPEMMRNAQDQAARRGETYAKIFR